MAPDQPRASEAEPAKTPGVRLEQGYLRVRGHERAPLVDALTLRVPHLAFEPFEAAAASPVSSPIAFVELQREPTVSDPDAVAFVLTIVVSDGRAFDRRVETRRDDDEIDRLLASTVANLLLAIEAGTVEADRGDVPLPAPVAPTCPAVPECECPEPPACPVPVERPVEPETPVTVVPPRIEVGPVIGVSSILGLGEPASADRFAGAGATLGVHARLRRGALFGLEFRGAGRGTSSGIGLARTRFAVGAGYRLRRGAWSLGGSLWATVEPWWARGGEAEPEPSPSWGLAARISPALVVPGLAGDRLGLAIGPTLELATSASFTDDGLQTSLVTLESEGQTVSQLRVGGVELSTGLSVTLWFGPRVGGSD